MKLKSFFILLTIIFTFNTFTTKKAEAGLIVSGLVLMANSHVNEDIAGIVGLSGMVIAATSSIFFISNKIPLSTFRPFFYIGLDVDGSIPQAQLAQDFSRRYSFIDNDQIIIKLVEKVKLKFENNKKPGSKATLVTFSEEEVEDHFAGAELTAEEMSLIKSDLM